MKNLIFIDHPFKDNLKNFGSFIIEPLDIGQGITLGNALRRTLLSDLSGFAVTGARINSLKHEFGVIEGIREDILEILLNLKEIIFKSSFFSNKENPKFCGQLYVKGPVVVTAGMFDLPKAKLNILNPSQYICTILDNSELFMEIDIEKGKGYKISEGIQDYKLFEKFSSQQATTLSIDAQFVPIRKANYKIKLSHDASGNIKETLSFDIETNGSITPRRSLQEALKILLHLINPFFNNSNTLNISSHIIKSF